MMNNKVLKEKLNKVIEEKINPILGEHLGGLMLISCEDDSATVRFTGSCRTCYAAEETLENVVKDVIFKEVPEIKEVYLDNSVSDDLIDFAKQILSKEK